MNSVGNDYAAAIVQTVCQPILVLDEDLRVEAANPAFLRQFSATEEETIGQPFYELGEGHWDTDGLREHLRAVVERNCPVQDYRIAHEYENIGRRVMLLGAEPLQSNDVLGRILVTISDDTERDRLMFELEAKSEFAEKLIDSIRESLIVLSSDLRVESANHSFYECFGVEPKETVGHLIYELGNGQWNIPELRELLEDILPHQTAFDDFEVEHDFETIGQRTMLLNARRLDHQDLILLAIRDVTEQRESRERQKAFVGELQHRVKNILNNVRAVAGHTRRASRSLDEFMEAFEARLNALGRAQDLLVTSPSESVKLRDIIELELGAVGADTGSRYTADGPGISLNPRDAQAVAMTIHELTTNAAKYGALSTENGSIEIVWSVNKHEDQPHVALRWREYGAAIENTTPKKGFGSQLIERNLPHMLGGAPN